MGKVRCESLTGKSLIDASISQFDLYMNKILAINNESYIDMLLSKKYFHLKLTDCQPHITYLIVSQVTYCIFGTLIKTSFGAIVYFEPKNMQYKKLINGVIDRFKI